ncbi:glycosyltransferase family 4 protein [Hymenobacter latericus]|uniref:glycosyltransferase family 4 protein n=1 Tax=Hymenobacter sp. YIM 151858-1 TaxID=2987688 RepID=UPI00222785EF|nr:glycosyltransferase family 4 protein [Hymenobacter sp. YIM 151858-1]UYZ57445.1 glycosyltransferase family 4 protein [Hymenobacter sp. YIM 151858-1]
MNVLVAVEELRAGGAQTFALRFAQALQQAGHSVWLYTLYWQYAQDSLLRKLAPDVKLIHYQPGLTCADLMLQRAEGWLERHGYDLSIRSGILKKHLKQTIEQYNIDVVSSNTFRCDELISQVLRDMPSVPLVITMHGDYEQFMEFYKKGQEHVIPNYPERVSNTLRAVQGVAYLADSNLEVLRPEVTPQEVTAHLVVRRIYNGLDAHLSGRAASRTRAALGIEAEALVFGMVARGVAGKGWEPLVQAYRLLRSEITKPLALVLVGDGPALTQLQAECATETDIHFTGFDDNPVDFVTVFDVGVLASSLRECLPNSIAEYLFCGKACISTDVGEVRNMLQTSTGEQAGLLIPFPESGLASADELYQAMRRYALEPALLQKHQQLASDAFQKFDMRRCVVAYEQLYNDCLTNRQ